MNRTLNGLQDPVSPKSRLNYFPVYFAEFFSVYLMTATSFLS